MGSFSSDERSYYFEQGVYEDGVGHFGFVTYRDAIS